MKKLRILLLIILAVAFITACSKETVNETTVTEKENKETNKDNSKSSINESEILDAPVENRSTETDYLPAFPEQTRVNAVKTRFKYNSSKITSGLDSPWGIAALPDGSFAITEKGGTMRILNADKKLSEKIKGFSEVNSSGQGGLLDVKAAPDFEKSRILYFTFSEPSNEGTLTAVGKGKLTEDNQSIEEFETLYRALPYYKSEGHYGSRIAIDSDGNLFISTGDRMSSTNRMRVQELDNGHEKILHITSEGKPVGEGIFKDKDGNPEVYSYGHRNVQGLDIHPVTGELWASEMGPRGGDELNLIHPGKNYGWPLVSYGIEYSGEKIGEGITVMEDTEQPIYYWDPVLAPSGMTFYTSDEIPEWKNNLFIGGLASQHIARIVINDNKVVGEERLLEDLGERFRDIEVGSDGALYAITDSGNVYRIGK